MSSLTKTEQAFAWCETMPGATLGYPFGEQTAVFKIGGKIFALVAIDADPGYVTLKVAPDDGEALRSQCSFVREAYYMNKRHWMTVDLEPTVPMPEVREFVAESHALVAGSLSRVRREELGLAGA